MLLQGICFLAFIIAYQEYEGWQYVLLGAFSLYLVLFALMLVYLKMLWVADLRAYFVMNLLLPGLFIILYSLVPTVMTGKNYYNTFNKQRYQKSWEQYTKETEDTDSNTVKPYWGFNSHFQIQTINVFGLCFFYKQIFFYLHVETH